MIIKTTDAMLSAGGPIEYSVNELGLRGPSNAFDDAEFRILCVGGSTTECRYVTDRKSWPWRLQDELAARTSKRIFVGNAGRAGQFSAHHLFQLKHYYLAPKFDWVILLCGLNDMGPYLRNDYERAREKRVAQVALTRTPFHTFSTRDPYYKRLYLSKLLELMITRSRSKRGERVIEQGNSDYWLKKEREIRQQAVSKGIIKKRPPGLDAALRRYENNLRAIILECRKKNLKLLMLTQPAIYSENMPEELKRRCFFGINSDGFAYSLDLLGKVLNSYNEVMLRVCKEEAVDCIDLASLLSKDTTTFYDDCHFNISGSAKVTDILTEFFITRVDSSKK